MSCSSFCGSFSHSLNSGPNVCAAICAATETSPVSGSAATNFTSLTRIRSHPARDSFICLERSCALDPPKAKARTKRAKSSSVTLGAK